jgi:hypothetical protein
MNAVVTVKAKIQQIVSNKGHVRLFALVSVIWIAVAAPVFWKPLPYVDEADASFRRIQSCPAPVDPAKWDDPSYLACGNRVDAQVNDEVDHARFWQITTWASVVLLVPVILPLMLIIGAVIFQWIKDGYSKNPPANPN